MKAKIKRFLKSKIIVLCLIVLLFGTAGVYAATYFPSNDVTYDNTESGLSSTDVQGAIDELYEVCKPSISTPPSDQILDNVDIVTSGDGLYEDEYESGRYFYKGANPNNYITFNNEDAGWRIISLETNGTIKITKSDLLKQAFGSWISRSWAGVNNTFGNDWESPCTLNIYLNIIYYNGLSNTAKSQIVAGDFSIGEVDYNNYNMINQINDENKTKYLGNIATPTVSEYIRTNSNKSNCGTFVMINNNHNSCNNTGWLDTSYKWWTITPASSSTLAAYEISNTGEIGGYNKQTSSGIRPVVYLSSNITLNGSGTQSDPYTIE